VLCDSAIEVKSPESDILSNYSPFRVKIHQKMPVTNDGSGEQKSKSTMMTNLEGIVISVLCTAQSLF